MIGNTWFNRMIPWFGGVIVNHRYRIDPGWHGFMWAWHSDKNWRVGWILFGVCWYKGEISRIHGPRRSVAL